MKKKKTGDTPSAAFKISVLSSNNQTFKFNYFGLEQVYNANAMVQL